MKLDTEINPILVICELMALAGKVLRRFCCHGEKFMHVTCFAEVVLTGLQAIWVKNKALYTRFLPRPASKESNVLKLKSSYRAYCPIMYTVSWLLLPSIIKKVDSSTLTESCTIVKCKNLPQCS